MDSMYSMKTDSTEGALSSPADKQSPARRAVAGRRIQVRRSGIHGKGVFALRALAKGETVIEYTGEVISWREALRRHPHDPQDPHHTFYFHIDDKHVIDAKVGGNAARWINHSCAPNCKSFEADDGRVYIEARRAIPAGEELTYDYRLSLDGRITRKIREAYACRCGAKRCRGSLLLET